MSEKNKEITELLEKNSIFGLFLDALEIESLINVIPAKKVHAGDIVFKEGDQALDLVIPIDTEIELFTEISQGKETQTGTLRPGRASNLYAVVRELPFQYSGKAKNDGRVLILPWKEVLALTRDESTLESYLKLVTESRTILNLSKEIHEVGCSQKFRVELVGSLSKTPIDTQNWIQYEGKPSLFAFFVSEGVVHAYKNSSSGKFNQTHMVTLQTWQNWIEAETSEKSLKSYRTAGNALVFKIDSKSLQKVKEKFPKDYEIYKNWIIDSKIPDESEDEEEDIEEENLFKEIPKPKKSWFRYPFVQQNDEMDCGPACLAMISKYFGNPISIQRWRELVSTKQEGTSFFALAKGAEEIGFTCHGIYAEDIDDLDDDYFPIIFLRKYHFSVIYKKTKKHFVVADPGIGILKMDRETFYDGFENTVLLIKPTEKFFQQPSDQTKYRHYFNLLKGYGKEISMILSSSALLVIFSLFTPLLMQLIMDEVLTKKDVKLLGVTLAAGVTIAICQGLMIWIRGYYISYITSKFDFRSGSAFLQKVFSLPYHFFSTRHVGDFTRRLSEMERLRQFLTSTVLTTVLDIVTLGLYGILLLLYHPQIAIVTFIAAPLLVGLSMLFSKKLETSFLDQFRSRSELESLLTDSVKGASTIKSLSAEVATRWKLEEKLVNTLRSRYQFSVTASALSSVGHSYHQVSTLCLMATAAYLGIRGDLSPGQVVSISVVVGYIMKPFFSLASNWAGIQEFKAVVSRLNDVFLSRSENFRQESRPAIRKEKLRGEIEFRNVWFRYGGEDEDWALKGLSFRIEPGTKVAIVGESGSGKSSIAFLLSRLYEPQKGEILIDGRDYREYDAHWLRSQIGFLQQEPALFYGTLAENIAYGSPKVEDEQIRNCAKIADAHNFIMSKPSYYNHFIQHGGMGLSGGEKQRIALARTIFSEPSVLLLDEATAALDGATERRVLTRLLAHAKDSTIINISHRSQCVAAFDYSIILHEGKNIAQGKHEELLDTHPKYQDLFGNSDSHPERKVA